MGDFMQKAHCALSFMEAHRRAREELPRFFHVDDLKVQQMVAEESLAECSQAQELLQALPDDLVVLARTAFLQAIECFDSEKRVQLHLRFIHPNEKTDTTDRADNVTPGDDQHPSAHAAKRGKQKTKVEYEKSTGKGNALVDPENCLCRKDPCECRPCMCGRSTAEISGELHKERGRNEQLKRQLRGVTDERDEALAQDWRRVEQVREEKDSKGRLKDECEQLRRMVQETRQHAHSELQARSELQQQYNCNLELKQQEQLHLANCNKLESAEAETKELRSELQTLRAQCAQQAAAASAAALDQRNQRVLHKQQLDNLNEEHNARLQALNQQHMQQLTVQQHMLDPERLSTLVDDLMDEISCLREHATEKRMHLQEVPPDPKLPLPSPHLEVTSRRLAKMRQRLAQRKDSEETPPRRCGRTTRDGQRTPSPERVTQRLPYALEPITQMSQQSQDSPRTSQDALRAKMFTRLLARDSADATLETFVCSEGLCFWHNKKLQGFRVCCWQEIKDWSQVGMGDASGQEPISPEVHWPRAFPTPPQRSRSESSPDANHSEVLLDTSEMDASHRVHGGRRLCVPSGFGTDPALLRPHEINRKVTFATE
eukprot:g15603.t1